MTAEDICFKDISYLKKGSAKQRKAYEAIAGLGVMKTLSDYDPVLVGTIPIRIDTEKSDLDIICHTGDFGVFGKLLQDNYSGFEGFLLKYGCTDETCAVKNTDRVVCSFMFSGFEFEIFGQPVPVLEQNAYRHMLCEYMILEEKGGDFRREIIELKKRGVKTEPAFALQIGLDGDPYDALLKYGSDRGFL